ncbi:MAG: hypothetical protein M1370_12025 [Bacteroidetes bacterium]|nr:hypothetical protein [Bacteroidota bacterium]MCL5025472.1 hypothetical protein [Chloroflexota bacterium]
MAEDSRSIFGQSDKPRLTFEEAQIGADLGSYEYTLTQEQAERYRWSVEDHAALFPTIAVKHDASALRVKYEPGSAVNARQRMEFFNPPIPGKKIRVTGRIVDKYIRREKPYLVIEATAVDEDGRLIERTTTYQMRKTEEVGKKWG